MLDINTIIMVEQNISPASSHQPPATSQGKVAALAPSSPQKPKINWAYQFQQYGTAIGIALAIAVLFSFYLFFRRGYFNLYIANKVFANVAVVMLGIVLLLGPACRFFSAFDKHLQYRKEIGIVAFFLALTHGIVSFYFLPEKFPRERFFTYGRWPFVFGLSATVLLIAIFLISNQKALRAMGGKLWFRMQSWGVRTVFILVALHVGVMKWKDWLKWYNEGGSKELAHPEWPGAGLLAGWFILFVILIRLAELMSAKLGKAMWYLSVVALPVIYIFTFWWGRRFI